MSELFSAFGIDWKLLLIQGLNFGILLLILSKLLYKPMLKIIDERREKIAEGVRTAEEANTRLFEAEQKSQSIIGTASKSAEALVAEARQQASAQGQGIVKSAEGRASAILADAEARAAESKRQALQETEREIARAAMLAAEKILRKS